MGWLQRYGRTVGLGLTWTLSAALMSTLEVEIDPLTAWDHSLFLLFGYLIPIMALAIALTLYGKLADPYQPLALASRHGANRQRKITGAMPVAIGFGMLLACAGLIICRQVAHAATEPLFNRDLVCCFGIVCLATIAYTAYLVASTRLGLGRLGAWLAFAADLTLGHVDAGWSAVLPHRHVANLIGYPLALSLSARESSLILFGLAFLGVAFATARTPR
jgi:hypothetical protein